jgi:8-oxo-dGTP diphosphatase
MQKVTAAILVKDGKILIAKRKADDRQAGKWEFPGGTVEQNETPQACLKREMKEEFGIDVTVDEYIGESIYRYDHGAIQLQAYLADWESGQIVLNDHAEYRWVPAKQLAEYEFAPADIPFVEKLQKQEIEI